MSHQPQHRYVLVTLAICALLGPASFAQIGGGGTPVIPVSPEAGFPRPWEAGLQVSPYSVVNLFNGNLITAINITQCDPVGPPLEFTLYHNSAAAAEGGGVASPTGFTLGPGWTCTYAGCIVGEPGVDEVVSVIEDDGNEYFFTQDATEPDLYHPPAGKHDILEWVELDPGPPAEYGWVLTRPSQWVRRFDYDDTEDLGRLAEVEDSAGNVLQVVRDAQNNHRIDYIRGAAADEGTEPWDYYFHGIDFDYTNTQLTKIEVDTGDEYYQWILEYDDGQARLNKIKFPATPDHSADERAVDLTYTALYNRIKTITSRAGTIWTYSYYTTHKLKQVLDPEIPGDPDPIQYEQWFDYSVRKEGDYWRTTYTDRREEDWKYYFDDDGNFRKRVDPLTHERLYEYDAGHNCTKFTNELQKEWDATYGAVGNIETLTSPLDQVWEWHWDPVGDPETTKFWRLTWVEDPSDRRVSYEHNDPTDPTLVTKITEPADGQGNPEAVTTLEYYQENGPEPGDPKGRGQLKLVIDAHADDQQDIAGVEHLYEYDFRGYFTVLTEGLRSALAYQANPCVIGPYGSDAFGRQTSGPGAGTCTYDADNNLRGCVCGIVTGGVCGDRLGLNGVPFCDDLQCGLSGDTTEIEFDEEGRLLTATNTIEWGGYQDNYRKHHTGYDALGRPTHHQVTSAEVEWGNGTNDFTRRFDYSEYDAEGRLVRLDGPDGHTTLYQYDTLGRLWKINGGEVEYVYDDASRLQFTNYDTGAQVERHYDDGNRLTYIEYRDANPQLMHRIDYVWNLDNTLQRREETDYTQAPAVETHVHYAYDNRQRLISEIREIQADPDQMVYNYEYTYDQLGNRRLKVEHESDTYTVATYDTDFDDPGELPYATRNNRLLRYKIYDGDPGVGAGPPLPHMEPLDGPVSPVTEPEEV
ncbi:MAG: RHS repeat protein, partial [Planctomycetes bacterium]|nr:RHS repeat protein [Planctomycetota bacterium]